MAFNEKYVTVTGGGLHDGSSDANAWTLDEAYANYTAGDRVNIKAGVYAITQAMNAWTNGTSQSAPISLRGYKTTIGDMDEKPTSQIASGTDIPELQITNTSYYIQFNIQLYCSIENITFKATVDRPAVYTGGIANIYKRCRFISTVRTAAGNPVIDTVERNQQFIDCYFQGSGSGNQRIRDSSYIFIGCVFEDFNSIDCEQFNVRFSDCVFKNFTGNAIIFKGTQNGLIPIDGCTFYNISGDAISVTISGSPSYSYFTIRNNVFHTIGGDALKNFSTSEHQLVSDNNLFYNVTGSNFANNGFSMSRNELVDASDPFTDAAGGDYSLVSGSNGYNAAQPSLFEGLSIGSNRDCGAIQHQDPSGGGGATVHPLRSN